MDVEHHDHSNGVWGKYDHHFPPLPPAIDSSEAHITFDDSDGDDPGASFSCPFCYVDIEARCLCLHLEEDHCFDMKNAVCPVCAANFGRDLIGHLTIQHSHLLKKRKFRKFGSSANSLAVRGKDLEKLLLFLGIASTTNMINDLESPLDQLVSSTAPFLKESAEPNSETSARSPSDAVKAQSGTYISYRSQLLNREEQNQKAEYYQELIFSTIF